MGSIFCYNDYIMSVNSYPTFKGDQEGGSKKGEYNAPGLGIIPESEINNDYRGYNFDREGNLSPKEVLHMGLSHPFNRTEYRRGYTVEKIRVIQYRPRQKRGWFKRAKGKKRRKPGYHTIDISTPQKRDRVIKWYLNKESPPTKGNNTLTFWACGCWRTRSFAANEVKILINGKQIWKFRPLADDWRRYKVKFDTNETRIDLVFTGTIKGRAIAISDVNINNYNISDGKFHKISKIDDPSYKVRNSYKNTKNLRNYRNYEYRHGTVDNPYRDQFKVKDNKIQRTDWKGGWGNRGLRLYRMPKADGNRWYGTASSITLSKSAFSRDEDRRYWFPRFRGGFIKAMVIRDRNSIGKVLYRTAPLQLKRGFGGLITNNLRSYVDISDPNSYSGKGKNLKDLSGNNNNMTFTSNPVSDGVEVFNSPVIAGPTIKNLQLGTAYNG